MKKISIIIVAFITFIIIMLSLNASVEASTNNIICKTWGVDKITSDRTGWVHTKNGTYYFHKTRSAKYDIGEACRNEYRWRNNKLYYFRNDGRIQTSNSYYIELHRDNSVKNIYISGTKHKYRYNVSRRRYQYRKNGKWHDTGMQTNIWWMCDMQE